MGVTFGQVIKKAREIVNDEYPEAYRWSDAKLLRFAYDAVALLNKRRPESRYNGLQLVCLAVPVISDDMPSPELEVQKNLPVLLDPRWVESIEHCVAAKAFSLDESDTLNANRAATHFALYESMADS